MKHAFYISTLFYITVQLEIDERRNFLRDMEGLGQGDQYRTVIETEVSQVSRKQLPTTAYSNA